MVALRLNTFGGMLPIRNVRLLPEQAAREAVNVDTDSGALVPVTQPRRIKALNSSTRFVYKLPYTAAASPLAPSELDTATWVEFADADTDVLRSPIVNDGFDRYYWCSPSTGLRYATRAQLLAGSNGYKVGVPTPTAAPSVAPTGGTGPAVTRSYVVTWVSQYGEESAPSPPVEGAGNSDGAWTVTAIQNPVVTADQVPITKIRLYRTITAASGSTVFFLVVELPVPTSTYVDVRTDSVVSAGAQLESTAWGVPPAMDGIAAMPNGIFVGWKANTLYFSDNFRPHAWPSALAITVQHDVVGLGVFGNTCVVCTSGAPAAVTGVKSSTMTLTQTTTAAPCLSRGSIVSGVEGVYFASDNGLVLFGPSGIKVVTEEVIDRDQWLTDYKPLTLRACYTRGQYIALRGADGARDGFMMSPVIQSTGLNGVVAASVFTDAKDIGVDLWSGRGWLIDNGALYEWQPAGGTNSTLRWRSKEVHIPEPGNMSVSQVFFDEAGATVRMRVWADRRLVYDQPVTGNGNEFRLPSGFKATIWQLEIEANTTVHSVHMASTVTELRGV